MKPNPRKELTEQQRQYVYFINFWGKKYIKVIKHTFAGFSGGLLVVEECTNAVLPEVSY